MSFVTKVAALLATVLTLTVCGSAYATGTGPAAEFPFRHSGFDFKVAWKTSSSDQGVAIDGLLKNVRYPSVEGVDLYVKLVDKENRILAREATFPIPQRIGEYDYSPFRLMLAKGSISNGAVLQFLIRYHINEGGQGGDNWLSSFAVDASTGAAVVSKVSTKPDDW